jgi:hypothetical protein
MPTAPADAAVSSLLDTPYPVTDGQIACYRRDGFIAIENILEGDALRQTFGELTGVYVHHHHPSEGIEPHE